MTSFSCLGKNIIILNDLALATDMLDKATYSDRPLQTFSGYMYVFALAIIESSAHWPERSGWSRTAAFLPYHDENFRISRRYMYRSFGTKASVKHFHDIYESEARYFLAALYERPRELGHLARACVSPFAHHGIILTLVKMGWCNYTESHLWV